MRCERFLPSPYCKPNGEPVRVDAIWEVLLPPEWVNKIRYLAKKRKVTMSWIVRYCIFRLLRRRKLALSPTEQTMLEKIQAEMRLHRSRTMRYYSTNKTLFHRLQVCFYGEDEKWLRLAALELEISVSMLIRFAIYRYFAGLENEKAIPYWRLFWMGIKFTAKLTFQRNLAKAAIQQEFLYFFWLGYSDFWKTPFGVHPKRLL